MVTCIAVWCGLRARMNGCWSVLWSDVDVAHCCMQIGGGLVAPGLTMQLMPGQANFMMQEPVSLQPQLQQPLPQRSVSFAAMAALAAYNRDKQPEEGQPAQGAAPQLASQMGNVGLQPSAMGLQGPGMQIPGAATLAVSPHPPDVLHMMRSASGTPTREIPKQIPAVKVDIYIYQVTCCMSPNQIVPSVCVHLLR